MRRTLIPIISIIFLLLLSTSINGTIIQSATPQIFSDNFNNNVADGWTQQMGSWTVASGAYRVSVGIIENGISTVNNLNLKDCVIQTQLRFTDSVGFRAGIVFRYLDNDHYYSLEISNEYDKIDLVKYSPGNSEYGQNLQQNIVSLTSNVDYLLKLEVAGSSFSAFLDGKKVLTATDDSYSSGLVGLKARRADVSFDYFLVNSDVQTPTVTTFCESSMSQSSFNVKINGALTYTGVGISGAPILLSYSVTGGSSWQDLTLVHTDSGGKYSALWMLPVSGDYMLKALHLGDDNYLGISNIVNFSIVPGTKQSVFSVTSNSTLSSLTFNSENNELSFGLSGESGTSGYVNVYVPNSLLNDVSSLKVYLDSNQIQYSVEPQGDGWFLYFTYHHSAHLVVIDLGSSILSTMSPTVTPAKTLTSSLDWVSIAILVFMGIIAAAVVVATIVLLSKKTTK